jgi:predicted lipid-binding transport protein (Tim44 family)
MGSTGGIPVDLILFGGIALFLVLRLRSILGRRDGFERPPQPEPGPQPNAQTGASQQSGNVIGMPGVVLPGVQPRTIDAAPEPVAMRTLPDPASPVGQSLLRMQGIDRNFTAARFLDGAESAFRIIVLGFAAGARDTLHPLLSPDTYAAFEAAIAAREAAGETQRTEIRTIESATIESAELKGSTADITVRFVSDQVNVTLGSNGLPVAGADAVMEITDLWTFERDLATADPTWRLVAARSA